MSSYYPPCDIQSSGSKTIKAFWAVNPVGRAIVFVHGFNGDALRTWVDFPGLLPLQANCQGHDLIFYAYDGVYTSANVNAVMLTGFLDRLFADPAAVVNATVPASARRPSDFRYDRVLLAAHSLGSVVCRRALLNAFRNQSPWLDKTRMVLFAPAHRGARVQDLVTSAFINIPYLGSLLGSFFNYKYPVMKELDPQNSPLLDDLMNGTTAAIAQGATALRPHTIIWGEKDTVIVPENFPDDPVPKVYLGKGHTEVCKPDGTFSDPINDLMGALQ